MPKVVDHDEYRKELLEKSFEAFAEKGYGQLTMRELARHLKVSTGTLYHYFKSKEQIFEELAAYQADYDLRLAANLPIPDTLDERMKILLEFLVVHRDYLMKQCFVWVDFGRQHGFEHLLSMPVVEVAFARYMDFGKAYLGFDDDQPTLFLFSYMSGFCVDPYIRQQDVSLDKHCRMLCDAVRPYSRLK